MKYNIIKSAACLMGTALILGSCSERLGGDSSIGFTAEVASFYGNSPRTKAAPIGDPNNGADTYLPLFQSTYGESGFVVSAYSGTTTKLNEAVSTYSAAWTLNQNAKWYSGEVIDFYAVAPATAALTGKTIDAAAGQMSFGYSVPSDNGNLQPDLMLGYYSGTGVEGSTEGVRVAPLTFYHPLAAIRFKAGDIAGFTVTKIEVKGMHRSGNCTVDMTGLDAAGAISWEIPAGSTPDFNAALSYNPGTVAVQNACIGGAESAMMLVPQTLAAGSEVSVTLKDLDDPNTLLTFGASLEGVELVAGKILEITINFKGIELEDFDEYPTGLVIPWETQTAIVYNDFEIVPSMAYLCSGPMFKERISSLGTVTEIVFDRGGSVDEDGIEIQDPNRPDSYKIYAKYDNGKVRITTHANAIKGHQDLSSMFKDMTSLTKITWGLFFDTSETTDMNSMFMNCTSLEDINLIDVANTANVTDLSHMFDGCVSATRIVLGTDFDTKKVTDLSYMFNNCRALPVIGLGSKFDTRNVTDMSYMFCNCSRFRNLEVGEKFYTWKVRDFSYMFYNISVVHLHFNSRFAIKSYYSYLDDHETPVATNMMYNAIATTGGEQGGRYYGVYVTGNTWSWVSNPANTGYNRGSFNNWGTTGLPQIVIPTD